LLGVIDRRVLREAWRIAWPLIAAEAVDSILSFTDMLFVSRLGETAVAAVGLAGYASWVFFVVSQLFYMGALIVASQAYGAKLYDEASRVVGESLTAGVAASLPVVAAVVAFAEPVVRIVAGPKATAELLGDAAAYLRVRILGLPLLAAAMVAGAAYRAAGDTKPALAATSIAAAVNIALDPVLIFGLLGAPRMGVAGAAAASVAASAADLAAYMAFQRRLPFRFKFLPPGRKSLKAAKLGVPAMVERLVFALGNTAYIGAIARCGEKALAAHTVGIRVESLAYLPAFAVSVAATSLVGQAIGGKSVDEGRHIGWELIKMNTVFMAVMAAVLIGISPYAPKIFVSDPETARLATLYLILAAASEPALGAAMTASSNIRGAGNTVAPTVVNIASLYLARVAPAYILTGMMSPNLCPIGAWLAMDLDLSLRAGVLVAMHNRMFHRLARRVV
jgi:putative MATE family efflux protein